MIYYKIAFCFLIIDKINLSNIWKTFFNNINKEMYSIYIHCKYPEKITDVFFKQFIIKENLYTDWGVIDDAIQLLYKYALKDSNNMYFIPISESTIPIKSFDYIYNYLFYKKKKLNSYIKYWKQPFKNFNQMKIYYKHHNQNHLYIKYIKYSHYYTTVSWVILNRKHVNIIVSDLLYIKYFKNHWASCENYTMYLLSLHNEYENINVVQTTWEDWKNKEYRFEEKGMSPKLYDYINNTTKINIIKQFKSNNFFFARKFTENSNIGECINIKS